MSARRRALRALSTVLLAAGVLLVVDAALTVAWQEPVSRFLQQAAQGDLQEELDQLEERTLSGVELNALAALPDTGERRSFLARATRRRVEPGGAIGRLLIPDIDVDEVVVDGTDAADLRRGPGLLERSTTPGARGTTAIAGHRTTYGAPFRSIDKLEKGDRIELRTPYALLRYRVEGQRIVRPQDVYVLQTRSYDRLVLSACHPLYSAAKRIVVFARLVGSTPRGRAARVGTLRRPA